ncbi:MAG: threonine ammonia-lyase [Zymomonas mobilis subsp. pomaceae]|uniref:Threonine dehydratase n=1 Tax=Zymomonas mobilis subsp. pomaceae (strain ATCC 29192 / DSM 22645 / JCM 10191 / CCUG 17912 / NBRC 13757 / NCIMB 11200 / NRRL B-4491 / Barker I) TaxID=579138 RepID=F8ET65_ZYMMT|nr:threonine ammonia-lyase [Zymomonas mobilis]AEI36955.1 threonine dehydratase [Zymomonas mobilis subsp. pomaceae ATCC 29192]MDX5948328.1 threonine ammonia-lyase [Zymomonas mobilis subsp. pomaceae]GEB89084.1 threonine ammonia-lyase [Zymomonas mobilis subsp. pomaceae]
MVSLDNPETLPVSLDDVKQAHKRIKNAIVRTPTLYSRTLSDLTGAGIWLKFENLQFTASYKERGALNKLLSLDQKSRERGVIAASAGNHAQGLAYHGNRLDIPVTIVMPEHTPTVKVEQTRGHGAKIVLYGEQFDESLAHALKLAEQDDLTFVHPFNDPAIIAGQGTVALEMLEDAPAIDTLVVPVGGGGLISGCATVAKNMDRPLDVLGAEAELYPSMYNYIKGKNLPCGGDTLAEGIAVQVPGTITRRFVKMLVDDLLLVNETDLEHALSLIVQIEKTIVEGAGAACLGAVLSHPERFQGRQVGIIFSGGNIDTRLLANVLLRDLARSGRLARLRVRMKDQAGQLYKVAKVFHDQQVNIMEVSHQRIFTTLPAKGLCADIECETRDQAHLDRLIAALRDVGYGVTVVEPA